MTYLPGVHINCAISDCSRDCYHESSNCEHRGQVRYDRRSHDCCSGEYYCAKLLRKILQL